MAIKTINESILTAIADAIRAKIGVQTTYKPSEMAAAIAEIGTAQLESKTITANGLYEPSQGYDGFSDVTVNVPPELTPADEGKVVSNGLLVQQTSVMKTANGTYDTTTNNQVVVNVTPNLQQKTTTQNGTVIPDSGYDGLSQVVVNVPGGGQQPIASWDFTSGSLIDSIGGLQATINDGVSQSSAGLTITGLKGAVSIPNKVKGNLRTYEVDFGSMEFDTGSTVHHRLFMPTYNKGVIYRSTGYWSFYNGSWATDSTLTDYDFFANSTMKVTVDLDGNWKVYKDGILVYEPSLAYDFKGESGALMIGSTDGQSCVGVTVEAIRIYQ